MWTRSERASCPHELVERSPAYPLIQQPGPGARDSGLVQLGLIDRFSGEKKTRGRSAKWEVGSAQKGAVRSAYWARESRQQATQTKKAYHSSSHISFKLCQTPTLRTCEPATLRTCDPLTLLPALTACHPPPFTSFIYLPRHSIFNVRLEAGRIAVGSSEWGVVMSQWMP